jgi:hypothetical protein
VDAFFESLRGSELAILFTICAGVALTCMRLFPDLKTSVARRGIVSLELAWKSSRAGSIISSWRQKHLEGAAKRSIYLDFVYIPFYSFSIAFLGLLAGRAAETGLFSSHNADLTADFVAIGAWTAGFCDYLENGGLLLLLGRTTDQPIPAITSWVSAIKWALVLLAPPFSIGLLIASAIAAD